MNLQTLPFLKRVLTTLLLTAAFLFTLVASFPKYIVLVRFELQEKSLLVSSQKQFKDYFDVDVKTNHEVISIDRKNKTVSVKDASDNMYLLSSLHSYPQLRSSLRQADPFPWLSSLHPGHQRRERSGSFPVARYSGQPPD